MADRSGRAGTRATSSFFRDHALSIVALSLFALTIALGAVAGWFEWAADQRAHGEVPRLISADGGYVVFFLEQTFQNIQSEFLALAVLVALTAVLIHRGSKHSKDSEEEISSRVRAIRRRVGALEAPKEVR